MEQEEVCAAVEGAPLRMFNKYQPNPTKSQLLNCSNFKLSKKHLHGEKITKLDREKFAKLYNENEAIRNEIFRNDMSRLTLFNTKLKGDIAELKQSNESLNEDLAKLRQVVTLLQVHSINNEENLKNLEKLSFDGTDIIKISNFNEKLTEAKAGRMPSFYTHPIYTSKCGYKVCLRIFLNGDGSGKGTHVSIFLVIMRGEFDSILTWPFNKKVTFTILDQSSRREHYHDRFRPDPNSISFRRPTSQMNVGSGITCFCPQSVLFSSENSFIKENTMYLKVSITEN